MESHSLTLDEACAFLNLIPLFDFQPGDKTHARTTRRFTC